MSSPRLFLFHGTDSRASRLQLSRWERVFLEKHGEATRYVLEADELTPAQLAERLATVLRGQSLFPLPKLIVVKRLLAQEKGGGKGASKSLLQLLDAELAGIDETVTLALWEGRLVPGGHPVRTWFEAQEAAGRAKTYHFPAPSPARLAGAAQALAGEYGLAVEEEAIRWLAGQYRNQELQQRLALRLKTGDEVVEDDRTWWLAQLIEGAALRAEGKTLRLSDLEKGAQAVLAPVGPFDVVRALERRDWASARRLAAVWEEDRDEGAYFSLWAAVRWQARRSGGQGPYGLMGKLAAEVEVIAKNFPIAQAWLLEAFILRLQQASAGGENAPIMEPRRLWLAHLYRS